MLRGIERRLVDRIVERIDRFDDIFPIQARQFFRQRFDRIGTDVKAAIVLGAQQRTGFAVENLIGRAPRQAQHFAAALRVGVAEKILAFVDKAPAVDVDHDAVGIRIAVLVGTLDVGRFRIDQHRMAAAPVADRLRAEVHGQTEHLARVVARAANFHQIPARAEIARAHFRIGLEAAGGKHHGAAREIDQSFRRLHPDTGGPALGIDGQSRRLRFVDDLDAVFLRGRKQHLDQAEAAVVHRNDSARRKFDFSAHLHRVSAGGKNPFDAHVRQPARRSIRLIDENIGELFVGGILGHLHHIFEKFRVGIGPDLHLGRFFIRQVRQHRTHIVQIVVTESEAATGKTRVSAARFLRTFVQKQHAHFLLPRRQGCGQSRVAGADHDHVINGSCHRSKASS